MRTEVAALGSKRPTRGDGKKLWHFAAKHCSPPTVKLPKTLVEEI